jgi:hypothetical protein
MLAQIGPGRKLQPKRAPMAVRGNPHSGGSERAALDFNDGCRIALPETARPWKVAALGSRYRLHSVSRRSSRPGESVVPSAISCASASNRGDKTSACSRTILRRRARGADPFPVDTLGDVLGWFPYAVKFKEHHGCRLTCAISRKPIALFRDEYSDISPV